MTEDIIIVGGGPAGSYLGFLLAKNGRKPIIFDDSHPREKPCGGGISSFAIDKFPFLNEISHPKSPDNEIEIVSSKGISVMTKGQKSSWSISRLYFDNFLIDKALKHGAKLIKERVIDIKKKDDIWEIKTNKKKIFKTKIIVGADGVDSIVRKKIIGPIPKQNIGVCYGCYAKSDKKESTRIMFLKDRQGYAWCFPRHDHLSIGVGVESLNSKNIKPLFNELISKYYPHVEITSMWGAKIPAIKESAFYDTPCSGDNWILIGDAAGHVDPITAEGITYALWSAELASKAIIKDNISSFDHLWKKEYGEELASGCRMINIFYNPRFLEFSIKIALTSNTFSNLLYNIFNSEQSYSNFIAQIIRDSPKIVKEIFANLIK